MIYKKSIRKYGDDLKRQIIYILHDLFFSNMTVLQFCK